MVSPAFRHDEPGTDAQSWVDDPRYRTVPELRPFDSADGPARRLVVVAAHPDDESLGAGGLLATAYQAGLSTTVLLLTSGEKSHPDSPTVSPTALGTRRLAEAHDALEAVSPGARLVFLDVPDGAVQASVAAVTTALVDLIGDGSRTVLASPWRSDGHPDHEAAGTAAAAAATRTGATLLEFPVWFWHWGDPDSAPWHQLRRLPLSTAATEAKARAVQAHRSQVAPLSALPGDETLLTPPMLAHFARPDELFVLADPTDESLDRIHREDADPWDVDSSWYERRKRDLTTAVLPRRRFERALEVGCSRGALAEVLAQRCAALLAIDSSPAAVASATRRLKAHDNVSVQHLRVPAEWPAGTFDLVVVSEVAYFLSPRDLDTMIGRIAESLSVDGVVVLCHWRGAVDGWPLDGPSAHARFISAGLRPVTATYTERDFEIVLLSQQADLPEPAG